MALDKQDEHILQILSLGVGIAALIFVMTRGNNGATIADGGSPQFGLGGSAGNSGVLGDNLPNITVNLDGDNPPQYAPFSLGAPIFTNNYNIGGVTVGGTTIGGTVVAAGNGGGSGCCVINSTNGWVEIAPGQEIQIPPSSLAAQDIWNPSALYDTIGGQ